MGHRDPLAAASAAVGSTSERREVRFMRKHGGGGGLLLRAKLGEAGPLGFLVMGVWRMGDPGRRGTVAGDFIAAFTAGTTREQQEAFISLATHREVVPTFIRERALRQRIADLGRTKASSRWRNAVLPAVQRYALRLGWDEVTAAARTDDRLRDPHAFAQRLRLYAKRHARREILASLPDAACDSGRLEFVEPRTLEEPGLIQRDPTVASEGIDVHVAHGACAAERRALLVADGLEETRAAIRLRPREMELGRLIERRVRDLSPEEREAYLNDRTKRAGLANALDCSRHAVDVHLSRLLDAARVLGLRRPARAALRR